MCQFFFLSKKKKKEADRDLQESKSSKLESFLFPFFSRVQSSRERERKWRGASPCRWRERERERALKGRRGRAGEEEGGEVESASSFFFFLPTLVLLQLTSFFSQQVSEPRLCCLCLFFPSVARLLACALCVRNSCPCPAPGLRREGERREAAPRGSVRKFGSLDCSTVSEFDGRRKQPSFRFCARDSRPLPPFFDRRARAVPRMRTPQSS